MRQFHHLKILLAAALLGSVETVVESPYTVYFDGTTTSYYDFVAGIQVPTNIGQPTHAHSGRDSGLATFAGAVLLDR